MITVALLCYNEEKVLPITLPSAISQGYPIVCVDNQSTDRSRDILNEYGILWTSFQYNDKLGKVERICIGRREVLNLINTEYTFYLDADVKLPPDAINSAYFYLMDNPRVGCAGIQYMDGHVHMGATLIKTDLLRTISWEFEMRPKYCECMYLSDELKKIGLDMVHIPGIKAEHWRKGTKVWG